jgi:hypothetical protein
MSAKMMGLYSNKPALQDSLQPSWLAKDTNLTITHTKKLPV